VSAAPHHRKISAEDGTKRAHVEEPHLVNMMSEVPSPSARRSWLKIIRHLLQHAVPTTRKDNPAAGIAQVKLPKSKGHWTDDQIAQYRKHWKLGTQQRLVFEFALETVSQPRWRTLLRRADRCACVVHPRQNPALDFSFGSNRVVLFARTPRPLILLHPP